MKTNNPNNSFFDKDLLKNKKVMGIAAAILVCTGTVGYAAYQPFTPAKPQAAEKVAPKKKKESSSWIIPEDNRKKSKKEQTKKEATDVSKNVFDRFGLSETEKMETIKQDTGQSLQPKELLAVAQTIKEQDKEQQPTIVDQIVKNPAIVIPDKVPEKPTEPSKPKEEETNPSKPEIIPPVDPDPQPPVIVVDYNVLERLVANAEGLPAEAYLSKSYEAMQTQLTQAKVMLAERNATQSQVNAQVQALQNTINQLVLRGNMTELENLIEQVQNINRELYTTDSARQLDQANDSAKELVQQGEATQETIDSVLKELNQAIMQLVARGDKEVLRNVVNQAKSIDREIYTAESLQVLDEAVGQAQHLLTLIDATQEQVNEMVQLVQTALDGLQKVGEPDLSLIELNRLIAEYETLDLSGYTEQTVAHFMDELNKAKALVSNGKVTEEEVKAQITTLKQAKEGLEIKGDKTSLTQLVSEVMQLEADLYTTSSWEALQTALGEANQVLSDTQATQQSVDTAFTNLQLAKDSLINA
ncbi:TPA: hypothetical protein ACWMCB_002596 [Enterococcus faecalis]